jgi:quercetin dioxygenase-like cupin family protein
MSYEWIDNLEPLIGEIQPDSIVSRTLWKNEHAKAVLFTFDAGQELSEHQAGQPAFLYFVRGEATLTLDGDTREAQAGTWVHMPPRLKHSVNARTPLVMLLLLQKDAE